MVPWTRCSGHGKESAVGFGEKQLDEGLGFLEWAGGIIEPAEQVSSMPLHPFAEALTNQLGTMEPGAWRAEVRRDVQPPGLVFRQGGGDRVEEDVGKRADGIAVDGACIREPLADEGERWRRDIECGRGIQLEQTARTLGDFEAWPRAMEFVAERIGADLGGKQDVHSRAIALCGVGRVGSV